MIATKEKFRGPSDVVGVDIATTGVKLVRMKRSKDGLTVTHAELLPPVSSGEGEGPSGRIDYPKALRARNAALTYTAESAVIRLLSLPGFSRQSPHADQTVREHVGLEPDYRLGYTVTREMRGRADVGLVAVGLPEAETAGILALAGTNPAPISMEVSALSSLTAFAREPIARSTKEAVGVIEAGACVTSLAIFHQGAPVLLRKFEFGSNQVLGRVGREFRVDSDTAQQILADESFDVSGAVKEVTGSFLRQLAISKEFVERKVGAPIAQWQMIGGMAMLPYWRQLIEKTVSQEVVQWNPLNNLYLVPGGWPDELTGHEVRFAAAIGAAIGVLEGA